jgi:hypothetical protein
LCLPSPPPIMLRQAMRRASIIRTLYLHAPYVNEVIFSYLLLSHRTFAIASLLLDPDPRIAAQSHVVQTIYPYTEAFTTLIFLTRLVCTISDPIASQKSCSRSHSRRVSMLDITLFHAASSLKLAHANTALITLVFGVNLASDIHLCALLPKTNDAASQ